MIQYWFKFTGQAKTVLMVILFFQVVIIALLAYSILFKPIILTIDDENLEKIVEGVINVR